MAPPPIPALHGEAWPRRALLTVTGAAWQRPRFRSSGTCWTDGRFVGSRNASNVAMLAGASGKAVSVLAAADRLRARPSDACLLVLWPRRASMQRHPRPSRTYPTYPKLERARRCRLVVFGVEVGGRGSREAVRFVRLLARAQQRHLRLCVLLLAAPGCSAGAAFFPSQRSEPLQHRCWSCRCTGNAEAAALSPDCIRSLRIHAGLQLLPQAESRHAQREQTHVANKPGVWDELREKGASKTEEKARAAKTGAESEGTSTAVTQVSEKPTFGKLIPGPGSDAADLGRYFQGPPHGQQTPGREDKCH